MGSERPTEDIVPHRSWRHSDTYQLLRGGGVILPRWVSLGVLGSIFVGVAAGASWGVGTNARIAAVERAVDVDARDSIVTRHAQRISNIEAEQRDAARQTERVILVLCSLCKGLPKADCSEACKAGR